MHSDVQPGAAHGLARGRQAGHVAQLAQDRGGGQLADPVMGHQGTTARLTTSQLPQRLLEWGQLTVERLDHLQRHLDPLAGRVGQFKRSQKPTAIDAEQLVRSAGDAVVKQGGLDPLQPGGAFVDQGLAQPRAGAPLAHMCGRIQASGRRPSHSSVRSQRASSRSVLARRFLPRSALASPASAKCGTAPACCSASHTNSQPVHASTATSTRCPAKAETQPQTASGVAAKRPRLTSPVRSSKASKVICARCTSNPATIATRASSSSANSTTRESLAPSGGGPVHAIFARDHQERLRFHAEATVLGSTHSGDSLSRGQSVGWLLKRSRLWAEQG